MIFTNVKTEVVYSENETYIIVSGIIDTVSSPSFGEFVDECHNQHPSNKIYLDFSKVEMITSACIRELLRFKKSGYDLEMVGVRKEVNTVLKLTGMDEILGVKQEIRSIDTTGCKVLGKGFHSEVFKLNDETIAKVYFDIKDIDMLINERIIAKQAFVKGVPTEISFGMCESKGKPGLIYELVDADTLLSIFTNDSEQIDKYCNDYVKIVKEMNTFDSDGIIELPKVKDIIRGNIEYLKEFLNQEQLDKLREVLDSIPDSNHLIHGDPHPANVMATDKGLVFIDLSDMREGDGIFDLVYLNRTLVQFRKAPEDGYQIPREDCRHLWELFFNEYYKDLSEEEKALKLRTITLMSMTSIAARFLKKDPESSTGKMFAQEIGEMLK